MSLQLINLGHGYEDKLSLLECEVEHFPDNPGIHRWHFYYVYRDSKMSIQGQVWFQTRQQVRTFKTYLKAFIRNRGRV